MASTFSMLQDAKVVQSLTPATDAAGRTGDYVNLKNAVRAYAFFHLNQANAATIACSLSQAKTVGGGSAKAVTALVPIAVSLDVSVAGAGDVLTPQAAAASYTTDAALKSKIVAFEIDPLQALDVTNGFTCVALVTGASNVANITQGVVILTGLRYHQNPPITARS